MILWMLLRHWLITGLDRKRILTVESITFDEGNGYGKAVFHAGLVRRSG